MPRAKRKNPKRVAAGKKAARTRAKMSASPTRKRRTISAAPVRKRKISAKKKFKLMPLMGNSFKGLAGGFGYGVLDTFLMGGWNPYAKAGAGFVLGTIVSGMNGSAGAGVSGAAGHDLAKGLFSKTEPVAVNDNGNVKYVPANTFKSTGRRGEYMDNRNRKWTVNDKGAFTLAQGSRGRRRTVGRDSGMALADYATVYALSDKYSNSMNSITGGSGYGANTGLVPV